MRAWLDVNVLVAVLDGDHIHGDHIDGDHIHGDQAREWVAPHNLLALAAGQGRRFVTFDDRAAVSAVRAGRPEDLVVIRAGRPARPVTRGRWLAGHGVAGRPSGALAARGARRRGQQARPVAASVAARAAAAYRLAWKLGPVRG